MKNYYFIFVLFINVLFLGCMNQCHELTSQKKSQIEKQILNEWKSISTAIENSDSDEYATFISPNLIMMSSEGSVFYSKPEYIENVRNWFYTRKNTEIQNANVTLTVLEEDLVLLDHKSDFIVKYRDGTIQQVHHAVTFVFKKEPTGWKIIHGHESFKNVE